MIPDRLVQLRELALPQTLRGATAGGDRGHIGDADDWTPPKPCIELAANLVAAREPIALTVYPGAFHGFDGPSTSKRVRTDVPGGVNPGQGVTLASDPAAREDAYARMKAFLRGRLAP